MNALKDWVHARRDRLTWLDCDRYVWSVFAGAPERWHSDPGTMSSATAQAHKLLQSDVLAVDLLGPFSRHLVVGSAASVICEVLEQEEPRLNLAATVDAMVHQFAGQADIVLGCPSPRRLLGEGVEVDFDALDDVATALLDVVRTLADRPVHGLQITCDTEPGPDEDELDSWSSLLAAAQHYHWVTAIRLNGVTEPHQLDAVLAGDLLLLPQLEAEMVPDDRRHGGGLPPSAWADSSEAVRIVDAAGKRSFRFGEIPQDASPEVVLDRIKALH
ncbi:MAG: hypothetical protein H0V07_01885 [Propionibacteriales bacterium]|nr:hypothetical protein [Propionibacteriales bacterium]